MLRCPWNLCLRRLSFLPPLATGPPSNCDQISSHIRPGTAATYLDARAAPAPSACQPRRRGDLDGRPRPPPSRPTDSPDCSEEVFTRESQTSPFIPPLCRPKGRMFSQTLMHSLGHVVDERSCPSHGLLPGYMCRGFHSTGVTRKLLLR